MFRFFQVTCIILVSLLTTGCPSGTCGLPTPRRLGHYFSSCEKSELTDLQIEESELVFCSQDQVALSNTPSK